MHKTQIRWDDLIHDFVAEQAVRSGTTFAEFVRSAALVRASLVLAANDPTSASELLSLYDTANKALRALGGDGAGV